MKKSITTLYEGLSTQIAGNSTAKAITFDDDEDEKQENNELNVPDSVKKVVKKKKKVVKKGDKSKDDKKLIEKEANQEMKDEKEVKVENGGDKLENKPVTQNEIDNLRQEFKDSFEEIKYLITELNKKLDRRVGTEQD